MLPKNARLTVSADFARATKSGTRVTTENFVGYLYISPVTNNDHPKCGLIVNKAIGGSVARHSLARKVRHAVAPQLTKLPNGSLLVIRALAKNKIDTTGLEVEKLINKLLERSSRAAVK
ncbi:MAG: ribonuclease P protein component [Actinomycetota bacterium]